MNNLLHHAKLLTLSGVLALGGISAAIPAAVHAAPPPQIYPIEGPGEITIESNNGFTPGATGRLVAMTPDRSTVLEALDVRVNNGGLLINSYDSPDAPFGPDSYPQFYSANFPGYSQPSSAYVGGVLIVADADLGSVTAQTQIDPMPTLGAELAGIQGQGCQGPVYPSGTNWHPGANVQLILYADNNLQGGTPLDQKTVSVDQNGRFGYDAQHAAALDLHGYDGQVRVFAWEQAVWSQHAGTSPDLQACGSAAGQISTQPGQISAPIPTPTPAPAGGGSSSPGTGGGGSFTGVPRVHAAE